MSKKYTDTDLVYGDLKHTAEQLAGERSSPVRIRRLLGDFITGSQQLTEIMRKEFSRKKGQKWEAENFNGWNDVTDFFKRLRRTDYHEYPVTIAVEETQYYQVSDIFEADLGSARAAFRFTWNLGNPFAEDIPDGVQLHMSEEKTGGKISDKMLNPSQRDYVFTLKARTKEMEKALCATGINDVHTLVKTCFKILTDYYKWYKEALPL